MFAQTVPVKGIVWEIPDNLIVAENDLRMMHRTGVEAVRTGVVRNEQLLAVADTLGIQLYQDLPYEYLPSQQLLDTLEFAATQLDEILVRAYRHPSARHFGLARKSDTSVPEACAYFKRLAEIVHQQGPTGSRSYYLTSFPDHDQCAGNVHFVLLDAVDVPDPESLLQRWYATQDADVGIGAIGTWVRTDTLRGLSIPQSWEFQARYLEDRLNRLLIDQAKVSSQAVFVYRWRDIQEPFPLLSYDVTRSYLRQYGLHTSSGTRRLSFNVVQGIYTGNQHVFAFNDNQDILNDRPLTIFLGWLVFTVIGIYYATSLRFRHMIPRYFRAHNFYQNAVREGRDVLFGASTILILAFCLGWGIIVYECIESVKQHEVFIVFIRWLSEGQQHFVLSLLGRSWLLILLSASIYAFNSVLWAVLLSIISRSRQSISSSQAQMLVVWPRWPLLCVILVAMVVSPIQQPAAHPGAFILLALWILSTSYALFRTLLDYHAVTNVSVFGLFVAGTVRISVFLTLIIVTFTMRFVPEITFLWHMAIHTR